MPRGTEVHVGFFWPQSKQTCARHPTLAAVGGVIGVEAVGEGRGKTNLVGRLRLELLKDLERLLLGREAAHGDDIAVWFWLGSYGGAVRAKKATVVIEA